MTFQNLIQLDKNLEIEKDKNKNKDKKDRR